MHVCLRIFYRDLQFGLSPYFVGFEDRMMSSVLERAFGEMLPSPGEVMHAYRCSSKYHSINYTTSQMHFWRWRTCSITSSAGRNSDVSCLHVSLRVAVCLQLISVVFTEPDRHRHEQVQSHPPTVRNTFMPLHLDLTPPPSFHFPHSAFHCCHESKTFQELRGCSQ